MRRDTGIGLSMLALCGLFYWQAGRALTPPFVPIGPAFYPRVILILLAVLAVWLIAEDVFTARRRAATPAAAVLNYRLVVICFIVFGGYVVGLSLLGYLLATFLFVLGLGWVMGPCKAGDFPTLALVAIGTAIVTHLIFEKYLHVFLPSGLLF